MKIKDGVIINEVDGQYIAVDTSADDKRFNGMLRMNKTACFVASLLEQDTSTEQVVEALTKKYDVSKEKAEEEIKRVVEAFDKAGLLQ